MLEIWDISDQLPERQSSSKKLLTDTTARHSGTRKM
jgi:hypothetical protein